MIKTLVFIFSFLTVHILSYSQLFEYSEISLDSVTFSGNNIQIQKDDGTGIYHGAQFIKSTETSYPIAYPSNTNIQASAHFTINCEVPADSIYIKGIGNDDIIFESKKVAIEFSEGMRRIYYPPTNSSIILPLDVINFYDSFVIHWQISWDNVFFHTIDSSSNRLYITKNYPMHETSNFKYFESVFHISCKNAAGNSTEAEAIASIWEEFTDQQVYNANGDTLFYYKTLNTSNTTLPSLLKYRNAQCYTFAQLFLACIKIQGIVRSNNYINITPNYSMSCFGAYISRFLVKKWSFGSPSALSTCSDFPFHNTFSTLIPPPYTSYSFLTMDVTDLSGIPGPGNPNPSSYFNNHQIAYIDGIYYDACYGVAYPTLAEYTTESICGWGFHTSAGSGITNGYFTQDLSLSYFSTSTTTF